MDNGKRYYVIDRSIREFSGTIMGKIQNWTTYAEVGDELTDTDRNVRIIRTR